MRAGSVAALLAAVFIFAELDLQAGNRHMAIIVDTSGSMETNDPRRYAVQLSQVLSDLTGDTDELAVIRMPTNLFSFCWEGASPALAVRLDPSDRATFKRELDQRIQYNTGTYFAGPIRTAISILPKEATAQRMLLVIADSGGLGGCEQELTKELLELKREGVTIAAINIGSSSGAFDSNPAFDFTTASLSAQGLIDAVAMVYQRFLGAKRVQTGRVDGDIDVEIAPYVNEAFLVVAADGPIGAIGEGASNPSKSAIDLDHRGGGTTNGLDGRRRGYRIVRIDRPESGRWRFRASGLGGDAAWMLLQDSSVGVRLVSPAVAPKDTDVPLEVELFDQRTGKRISDTSRLPGLQMSATVDGRKLTFRDDGQSGDRKANDGVLTATTRFAAAGDKQLSLQLQSDFLDRRMAIGTKVIDAAWKIDVRSPKRVEAGDAVVLSAALVPFGSAAQLTVPDSIAVSSGGAIAELRDDGVNGDRLARDRVFTGRWTPLDPATYELDYAPRGGSATLPARAPLEVTGRLRFGSAIPVHFGRVGRETTVLRRLDLRTADVRGTFELHLTTSFSADRAVLEIDTGDSWKVMGEKPLSVQFDGRGDRGWPLRLRVGECPGGHRLSDPISITVSGTAGDGRPLRTTVPVVAEIVADPWLHCWWPVLALIAVAVAGAFVFYGYWSPSRFPARLGVVLSPEEDITEGFFHPIRGQRGSRAGFYRDARIYICQDFRLDGRSRNGVAGLRANRTQVRIEPVSGSAVWRRNADGAWERIPAGESVARYGDLYRNDPATLFFELRNA